jgi:hypothetical protein
LAKADLVDGFFVVKVGFYLIDFFYQRLYVAIRSPKQPPGGQSLATITRRVCISILHGVGAQVKKNLYKLGKYDGRNYL